MSHSCRQLLTRQKLYSIHGRGSRNLFELARLGSHLRSKVLKAGEVQMSETLATRDEGLFERDERDERREETLKMKFKGFIFIHSGSSIIDQTFGSNASKEIVRSMSV